MLETVIGLTLWFAVALATTFALKAYGWLGLLGVVALVELCHLGYRIKNGRWLR